MDRQFTIALFGESEKGSFQKAYYLRNLSDTVESLGHPPPQTRGIYYAVQALLYNFDLLYFRVREEGYSNEDYLIGIQILEAQKFIPRISAICMPGVGSGALLKAITPLCRTHSSILITTEADLYDFLTEAA